MHYAAGMIAQWNAYGKPADKRRCSRIPQAGRLFKNICQICQFSVCLVNTLTYLLFIDFNRDQPQFIQLAYYFFSTQSTQPVDKPRCLWV